jgi:hypothetical protein
MRPTAIRAGFGSNTLFLVLFLSTQFALFCGFAALADVSELVAFKTSQRVWDEQGHFYMKKTYLN